MTLLKLEFKSLFRGLVLWTGILALILIVSMAFFPFMESGVMADLVGDNRGVLPMPLLALFGFVPDSQFLPMLPFILLL